MAALRGATVAMFLSQSFPLDLRRTRSSGELFKQVSGAICPPLKKRERDLLHKECRRVYKDKYRIVPVVIFNKYVHYGASETE